MNQQYKAIRALSVVSAHYRERWPELSELPPEDICNFLCAEGWTWNPHDGRMGRCEKSHNHQGEKPNGKEEK